MEKLHMVAAGRWLSLVCASLGILVSVPEMARAQSELTWAQVVRTRNQVNLFRNGQSRRARVSDYLGLNDALSTARRARAELRFNDGSLARIGESAVFRFTPNTRNFRLSNGTVLLLIPPGQGRTTIQTPNTVTGIRGSALFVRFIPETNTTIIGALTNNVEGPMVALNRDGSIQQPLYAGEMAVLRGDNTLEHYSFDLPKFIDTSPLIEDLGMDALDSTTGDPGIDAVRQEIKDALQQYQDFEDGAEVFENPSFLSARPDASAAAVSPIQDFERSPAAAFLRQDSSVGGFAGVVSGTVNQPAPATRQPTANPQPPKPQVDRPVVSEQPTPTPPTPPAAGPVEPIEKPPLVNAPVNEPIQPAPIAEPIDAAPPAPVQTPVPDPVEQPIEQPIVKPPLLPETPAVITETPVLPPENVVPDIDTVEAPATDAQIDRLPDDVVVQGTDPTVDIAPETPVNNSTDASPPGLVGETPGQSEASPPGQVGATPGQSRQ